MSSGPEIPSQSQSAAEGKAPRAEVIVRLADPGAEGAPLGQLDAIMAAASATRLEESALAELQLWSIGTGDAEAAAAALDENPLVAYAEVNRPLTQATPEGPTPVLPDDAEFEALWGLDNTGQTGGSVDADIDAPEAWERATGGAQIVVAVIDGGIDYTHPDLAPHIWTNPGEVPGNGLDDDGNGYVDDVHGYDFANDDPDPIDTDGHGTHVAGTIGAVGNNGIGVAGVMPEVQLMAVQFLEGGSGYTFDAIQAIDYAVAMGAQISNNSWGGGGASQALRDTIAAAGEAGHLFVAAAGNSGADADAAPHYPAAFDLDTVISVGASTASDTRAGFSNYGAESVDLFAPGDAILSTLPGGTYGHYSGTSMAAPHVAGVAGLILSTEEGASLSPEALRARLIETADPVPALQGLSASGGRLNAAAALDPPAPATVTGRLWHDLDGNGVWDPAEPALPGRTVFADADADGRHDPLETAALTDAEGRYRLTLPPGPHRIAQVLPAGWEQTAPTGRVEAYTVADSRDPGTEAVPFTDIAGLGTPLALGDDSSAPVVLPFAFPYFDEVFDRVEVASNGVLSFDGPFTDWTNEPLPDASAPHGMLAPHWSDLNPAAGGTVYSHHDTASDRMIFQWDRVPHFFDSRPVTFQVALSRDGGITFVYRDVVEGLDVATVGLEAPGSVEAIQLAYDEPFLADGLSVAFTPLASRPGPHGVTLRSGAPAEDLDFGANGPALPAGAAPVVAFRTATLTDRPQTIAFGQRFTDPVVIAQAPSGADSDPVAVRISAVDATSVTLALQEPEVEDGTHGAETVSLIIVEAGSHLLPDGTRIEAGHFESDRLTSAGLDRVDFDARFAEPPAIFTQIQSKAGRDWAVTRQHAAGPTGFETAMQEEERRNGGSHATERLGWVAMERGARAFDNLSVEIGQVDGVRDRPASLEFETPFAAPPGLVTGAPSLEGPDPAVVRIDQITATDATLRLQEETSRDAETGHIAETVDYLAFSDEGALTGIRFAPVAEVQTVSIGDRLQTVTFRNRFEDPVVIAQAPGMAGSEPAAIRIHRVGPESVDLRLEEPANLDGNHRDETVSLLIVERGAHRLADGTLIEAGAVSTDRGVESGFESVAFRSAFGAAPAVFSQLQTASGADWAVTRQRGADASGVELALQRAESATGAVAREEIGWVAVDPGPGAVPGLAFEAGSFGDRVTAAPVAQNFAAPFAATPGVVTGAPSYDGADPAVVRVTARAPDRVEIRLQEETTADAETEHTPETVDYFAFEDAGTLSGGTLGAVAELRMIALDDAPTTVWFQHSFDNPVVIAQAPSFENHEPVAVRIEAVDARSVTLRLQEPDHQDGHHGTETLALMVVEAGSHRLADGSRLEAGTIETGRLSSDGFESVAFDGPFADDPAVFTQLQSANGPDWAVTRQREADSQGFEVTLQEQERWNGGTHATETVGWVALEQGRRAIADLTVEVGRTPESFGDTAGRLDFSAPFAQAPGLVTGAVGFEEPDPAMLRIVEVTAAGAELHVQEETSADAETDHLAESVDYIAFEGEGTLQGYNDAFLFV